MLPSVAAVLCVAGIVVAIRWDREGTGAVSPAIWLPVLWIAIGASREPSVWLEGFKGIADSADGHGGSMIDQLALATLIVAGLITLAARGRRAGDTVDSNLPVLLFLAYGLLSVVWSDFPDVAFKRWTKALGNVVMVLVVLTDRDPSAAFKTVLSRTGFLLIPASVVLIKYYPHIGRSYSEFAGRVQYLGVAEQKNSLGHICLIFGLANLWRIMPLLRAATRRDSRRLIAAHGVTLAMALWLLAVSGAATSKACFAIGLVFITIPAAWQAKLRTPARMHAVFGAVAWLGFLAFVTDVGRTVLPLLGRDATLTGRTDLWASALALTVNPIVGAGFESFWLGERIDIMWRKIWWHPNQAHNGYLETYLNLGWVGVAILAVLIGWGYRNVVRAVAREGEVARLKLAFYVIAILYNFTEAAVKVMHPVWLIFLLSTMAAPAAVPSMDRPRSTG